MRDVLRIPGMGRLLAGETTSMFGDWVLLLVMGIWVKTLTGSNSLAGATLLAIAAPSVVSPLFGWIVDRFRRRPFLIVVNLLSAVAITPLFLVRTRDDVWLVFVVAVAYGVSASVTGGAFAGLIKELVPDEQLGAANGMFSSVRQVLRLCGPLAGAGLFAAVGGRAVALLDIVSFVVAALAIASIPVREERPVRSERRWLAEAGAGLRHIYREPALRRSIGGFAVAMLALGAVDTVVFAFIDEGLHRPPAFVGVLVTISGIGAVVGALCSARLMKRVGEVAAMAIAVLSFGAGIGLIIYPSLALALIAMPLAGVANAIAAVAFGTLLQRRTPGPLMGRVSSGADMLIGGAQTASMAAGASLLVVVDYKAILLVVTVALLATGVVLWRSAGAVPPAEPAEPVAVGELVG